MALHYPKWPVSAITFLGGCRRLRPLAHGVPKAFAMQHQATPKGPSCWPDQGAKLGPLKPKILEEIL